jgi:hypothetical protein
MGPPEQNDSGGRRGLLRERLAERRARRADRRARRKGQIDAEGAARQAEAHMTGTGGFFSKVPPPRW